ncbi:uncharacterized protein LOC134277900, partial [Saccostrea cucullata]|uniref:uncharacterized protein LOC134277900 n=1 Tax=Saccostrea cuccullata TaxID=36930 RepID=UPI002ED61946
MFVLVSDTVNLTGDLIYIDRGGNIIKPSKDNKTKSTLIKKTERWVPRCIYTSHRNGDFLVGMQSYNLGIIARYNDIGQYKQTIQHGNIDRRLFHNRIYITENRNGDVIVSDFDRDAVVVTDSRGRHRFFYTGHPRGSRFFPLRICTDALSHILVCDFITSAIHMLDKDGHFLSLILKRRGMDGPTCVLTTLRFLAKGEYLSEVGDLHGISISSASRIVTSVTSALCESLDNVKFPESNEELSKVKEDFYQVAGFPNVVGAIDETLIPIQGMTGDEEPNFICRKGYPAINVQGVVDANLRKWLLTPFVNPRTPQEQRYNNAHSTTRNTVERAFGVLKSRFSVMLNLNIIFFINKLHEQEKNIKRLLSIAQNYEQRSEQSLNRQVKFLLFLKKTRLPNQKDTLDVTQHTLLSLTEKTEIRGISNLLSEIQIIETGKRQLRNESLLNLMSTPMLQRSFTVTGVSDVRHISFQTPDLVWISDNNNLVLTNKSGERLLQLRDISGGYGAHTFSVTRGLIYIDNVCNINKLSTDMRTKSTLLTRTGPYVPLCVFCSPSTGELLVGMCRSDTPTWRAKVTRYNHIGQQIKTIQHTNTGQELYSYPVYITENRNGDVIVSDLCLVVVTERGGRHRFSYTGHPSGSWLSPQGLCTDALSNILVCDGYTDAVQIVDKNGVFLSLIQTQHHGIEIPCSLSYDGITHQLWVGSLNNNRMCVYRYINKH